MLAKHRLPQEGLMAELEAQGVNMDMNLYWPEASRTRASALPLPLMGPGRDAK